MFGHKERLFVEVLHRALDGPRCRLRAAFSASSAHGAGRADDRRTLSGGMLVNTMIGADD
jgi:hypothetical protein